MSNETDPAVSVSEDTRLKMPVRTLIAIVAFVAVAAASWASIKFDVIMNAREMQAVKQDVKEVQVEQQAQRELLIRIDSKVSR